MTDRMTDVPLCSNEKRITELETELQHGMGERDNQAAKITELEKAHGTAVLKVGELSERINELEAGIQKFLDGDYPCPGAYRPKQCPHETYYWEECQECNNEFLGSLLKQEQGDDGMCDV